MKLFFFLFLFFLGINDSFAENPYIVDFNFFVSTTGEKLCPEKRYLRLSRIGNGYYWGLVNDLEKNQVFGCIVHPSGRQVTPAIYEPYWDDVVCVTPWVVDPRDSYLHVNKRIGKKIQSVLLFMDGTEVPEILDATRAAYSSLNFIAILRPNGKVRLLDVRTKSFVPGIEYDAIYGISSYAEQPNFPIVQKKKFFRKKKVYGIIDLQGKMLVDLQEKRIISADRDAYVREENGTNVLVRISDGIVLDKNFRGKQKSDYKRKVIPKKARKYVPECRNGKWGFLDANGKEVTPFLYDAVIDVRDEHFRAKIGKFWGIFALDGTCKLPAIYQTIYSEDDLF